MRSGHLMATVARTDGALSHIVHQAFSSGRSDVATGGCLAVPRPSGRRPYLVRVIPLAPEVSAGVVSPTALIVIVDPEKEPEPELQALRRLYGLTSTEAEIALRVLDGTGLGPIADELSVSLATVRTHLQHVFDKTDTHRQAELVRLLLGGLAATRRPGTI
jgi:DNA-binding CsgD family transcriptional regulator